MLFEFINQILKKFECPKSFAIHCSIVAKEGFLKLLVVFYVVKSRRAARLFVAKLTSWGGTSKDTVRRSTLRYVSMQGMMKKIPGPLAPPFLSRPSRNMTDLSYSCTTCNT